MIGSIQGDQSISFQAMKQEARAIAGDRAGGSGGGDGGRRHRRAAGQFRLRLHLAEALRRSARSPPTASSTGCAAISRSVAGARLFLVAVSDLRTGGRQSNATYQYTLLSDDTAELYKWAPRLTQALIELRRPERRQFRSAARRAGGRRRHRPIDHASSSA